MKFQTQEIRSVDSLTLDGRNKAMPAVPFPSRMQNAALSLKDGEGAVQSTSSVG